MSGFWIALLDRFSQYAPRKLYAYPVFLVLALVTAYLVATGPLGGGSPYVALGVAVFALLGLVALHAAWMRPPRVKANAVGVGFAITCEDAEERKLLKSDFIGEIRRALAGALPGRFHAIEFPDYIARPIEDVEGARKVMYQSGLHFLFFGNLRKGTHQGKEWHRLRLTCVVRHRHIARERSKLLSEEMTKVLPLQFLINSENDLAGFELGSAQYADGARLVIATAAMISGDVGLATSLLEGLWEKRGAIETRSRAVGTPLLDLVRKRLADCYLIKTKVMHQEWRATRKPEVVQAIEDYLERANALVADTPDYHNSKAICAFVLRRDVKAAERALLECKKSVPEEGAWRYGLAFLKAYGGDLQGAWKMYREAFEQHADVHIPNETEEFMLWVLEQEPGKYQLRYCLGVINMRSKNDYQTAIADFEAFLDSCPVDKFVENRNAAERYIADLRGKLAAA